MAPSLESTLLALAAAAAAMAGVVYAIDTVRQWVGSLRSQLRTATAKARISDVLLLGESDAVTSALPAVGLLAGGVTALYPVTSPANRSRFLVAAPPDRTDADVRAAAALLAAVSVSSAEVPELARAVRSGLPQRGIDIGALLRRGGTSLPYSTRDKLFDRLGKTPFVVVPVARPGAEVTALLLALGTKEDLDRKADDLARITTRLALLVAPPRKGPVPAKAETEARVARALAPPMPDDADVVLWLDANGEVASCEMLKDDWAMAPPRSLHEIFGQEQKQEQLLERASREEPVALGLARFGEETMAEVSLLRLADGDQNTWGYAAFLRRVVA